MAKKKRIKRVSSQTSSENSTKAASSIIKALSFAEPSQSEKQDIDINDCTCSKKPVTRRTFLLDCISSCVGTEPCPVHPNVQRKKGKKARRKKGKKEQGKKGEKKSKELENETKQKESLLKSIKHRLFKKKTSDQAKADWTPVPETPVADGTCLTGSLRNEESLPPQVTEEIVPPQVTEEYDPPQVTEESDLPKVAEECDPLQVAEESDPPQVAEESDPLQVAEESDPPQVTEETEKYLNGDPKNIEVPQVPENQSSGDGRDSYSWSKTDEPLESNIFNVDSFEIPGVPRREAADRGSYEDWVQLKSILLTGLATGDHQGAEDRNRNGIITNKELPIWQRKRTRHIPRLY